MVPRYNECIKPVPGSYAWRTGANLPAGGGGGLNGQPVLQVYVDRVFVANFLVDLLWVWATALYARLPIRAWRAILTASMGGGLSVWAYFPSGWWLVSLPGLSVGTLALAAAAFLPCRLRLMGRALLWSLLIGAGMAGGAMLTALKRTGPGGTLVWHISSPLVPLGLLTCAVGARYLWEAGTRAGRTVRGLFGLRVRVGLYTAETLALQDTGNGLREPLSGLPVTVVDAALLQPLLPPELLAAARAGWIGLELLPAEWLGRCRLVPFRAVGQPGGALLAFAPDEMLVRAPGTRQWRAVTGLVGLSAELLHPEHTYRALLPAEPIQADCEEPGMTVGG
jgi:stage II sporulation protein GA (sporulation sigma-E factor processing peptidase)